MINVEPFSSLGGDLPCYFDGSGNPLPGAPVLRYKPEIVTPDGVNTTFFGTDIALDPDSFPNMFGTSPASAHAAAVGALLRERNPALSPGQIRTTLMDTATDIESPGIDSLSGAGLVNAFAAVQATPAAGDTDGDGILEGDGSNPCSGGNTIDCDDNCPATFNPDQADGEGDGVGDVCDNCTLVTNAGQLDTDGDNIGNQCDCDFNQDNFCGGPDFTLFIGCFNATTGGDQICQAADMNGDNFVGGPDFTLFIGGFNGPPGPSGL